MPSISDVTKAPNDLKMSTQLLHLTHGLDPRRMSSSLAELRRADSLSKLKNYGLVAGHPTINLSSLKLESTRDRHLNHAERASSHKNLNTSHLNSNIKLTAEQATDNNYKLNEIKETELVSNKFDHDTSTDNLPISEREIPEIIITTSCERKETLFDWWVLFCAFMFNVFAGCDITAFSVLYGDIGEYFGASRAAVGWCTGIQYSVTALTCKFKDFVS